MDVAGRGLKRNGNSFGTEIVSLTSRKLNLVELWILLLLKKTRGKTIFVHVIRPEEEKGACIVLRKFPYEILLPGMLGKWLVRDS